MPFGSRPCCSSCKTTVTTMWRKRKTGTVVCNGCYMKNGLDNSAQNSSMSVGSNGNGKSGGQGNGSGRNRDNARKSGRSGKRMRYKQIVNMAKAQATKGKNRRVIFKKNPLKSPEAVSTTVTSGHVFHRGVYYQIGDIVSLLDVEGGIYYAQLRGFLQDQYSQKSAIITWLLPTQATTKGKFDPSTYILGPDEELPRSMEFMEFVCHCPSDYYRFLKTPYPIVPVKETSGFMWSSVLPRSNPTTKQIFEGS
ncbi:GATA zinc finger domain-containing protein 1-like [Diadema setosum]|uniref:GATA zinc finger domain-containing protein 1-like n=1 Tax=Diadema setosum TaxID=31175 RepID=UPI003B3AD0F4